MTFTNVLSRSPGSAYFRSIETRTDRSICGHNEGAGTSVQVRINRFVLYGTNVVHSLPLTSLHIFYDLDGGLIAFNRNGSIFFNLRYYETWREHDIALAVDLFLRQRADDADVEAGRKKEAYVSW